MKKFPVIASFSDRRSDLGFKQGIKNRKKFLKTLGIDFRDLGCLRQPHGSKIIRVNKNHKGRGALSFKAAITGDAMITNLCRIPLSVFTADCLSIFLFCPQTNTIALVHAGWRGTKRNITGKTVTLLQDPLI